MTKNNYQCVKINLTGDTLVCTLSEDWFLSCTEGRLDADNVQKQATIEPLINGKNTFERLYDKILHAEKSVDIAIWGFQPSMFFLRTSTNLEKDANGNPKYPYCIGDLLIKKAMEGVQVKVLVWAMMWHFQTFGEANVGNMPGLSFLQNNGEECESRMQKEYDECWYKAVRGDKDFLNMQEWTDFHRLVEIKRIEKAGKAGTTGNTSENEPTEYQVFEKPLQRLLAFTKSGKTANLQYKSRILAGPGKIPYADTALPITTRAALSIAGSHHQKTVLIDYEDPAKAVGFVLEHNMVDNYWDDSGHEISVTQEGSNLGAKAKDKSGNILPKYINAVYSYQGRNSKVPLQDVSSMLTGPILHDINRNFCQSWNRNEDNFTLNWSVPGKLMVWFNKNGDNSKSDEEAKSELKREPPPKLYPRLEGAGKLVYAQILRTYDKPEVEDIKQMYLLNIIKVTRYLYTENQYFRWQPLVNEFIKHWQENLKSHRPEQPIFWFVVTNSSPAGMGSSAATTGNMLARLGRQDVLLQPTVFFGEIPDPTKQREQELARQAEELSKELTTLIRDGKGTLAQAEALKARIEELQQAQKEMEGTKTSEEVTKAYEKFAQAIGIKAHICTLAAKGAWNEVYIHSKVTVMDDVFTFIGSANLNTRSMQVDSELGVITECKQVAQGLRHTLWGYHTGNDKIANPPDLNSYEILEKTYMQWRKLMDKNKDNKDDKKDPQQPLCEFHRELSFFERIITLD